MTNQEVAVYLRELAESLEKADDRTRIVCDIELTTALPRLRDDTFGFEPERKNVTTMHLVT
jgi:hypothetical protein